jgi:hypothetical protein
MNAIADAMMVATNKKGRFCSGQPASNPKSRAARPSGQKGRWKVLPAPAWDWTGLVIATALQGWNFRSYASLDETANQLMVRAKRQS